MEIASRVASRLPREMQVYNMLIEQAIKTKFGTTDPGEYSADRISKINDEHK